MHTGVYALGPPARTRESRWLAAALTCGPGAAISHLSAACCWHLRTLDPVIVEVSLPRRSVRPRKGIRVHRPRHLEPEDVTRHRGIPVTTVPRTLIDVAEALSTRSLERTLDEAEFLKRLDREHVREAIARNPGRNGAARLAKLLDRHEAGTTRTRTPLEERLLRAGH